MMLRFLLVCFLLPCVFGGSPCPSREKVYPCICLDRRIGKTKFDTIVICQGLDKEPSLSGMEINTLLLYDSYWPTTNTRLLQAQSRIPANHVSKLKIDEVKIVDTILSNFACPTPDNCDTNYVKKFTAINATAPTDRCSNNGLKINTWISCPEIIEEITIDKGFSSSASLKFDFFPETMNKLRILRLPNNEIQKIDRRTFSSTRFPVLRILDLSHNRLSELKGIFTSQFKVEDLDLSHNFLRNIEDCLKLPNLKTLKLNDNPMVTFLENEWKTGVSTSITTIDLTNNKIVCDCGMKWLNSSLPIHTALLGTCSSPSETANKKFRRASRLLVERCKDGTIMPTKQKHN